MSANGYVLLESRGLLAIGGEDRAEFLQGLVSNDVTKIDAGHAIHAAFLTPQGKYLHDFFIAEMDGALVLDCEAERRADLQRRLTMYKLRSKVELAARDDLAVFAAFGDGAAAALGLGAEAGAATPLGAGAAFVDPRLGEAGVRVVIRREEGAAALEAAGLTAQPQEAYESLRIGLGLPDGSRDMALEKAILLENGFDELKSVDFDKGCYMGQELTARTKHRALIKKRLMPVDIDGPAPEPGTPIMLNDKEAGEMRSAQGAVGLALMRLEYLEQADTFTAGTATLKPRKPAWADF